MIFNRKEEEEGACEEFDLDLKDLDDMCPADMGFCKTARMAYDKYVVSSTASNHRNHSYPVPLIFSPF